jgi:hypothetical protein
MTARRTITAPIEDSRSLRTKAPWTNDAQFAAEHWRATKESASGLGNCEKNRAGAVRIRIRSSVTAKQPVVKKYIVELSDEERERLNALI